MDSDSVRQGAPPALQATSLSKYFGATRALASVDLTVPAGEIHSLLGGNGSGKSTLIKILSGYHQPEPGGEVLIGGTLLEFAHPAASRNAGARFVHQDLGLINEASIADNIAFGGGYPTWGATIRRREVQRRASDGLATVGLDIDPQTLVGKLSAAQKTGVAVARAMSGAAAVKLLVLDEPTATLPLAQVQDLLEIVRNVASAGVGVIYVTHRLEEIFGLATQATILRNGEKIATVSVDSVTRAELVNLLVGSELEEVQRESSRLPPERAEVALQVRGLAAERISDVSFSVQSGEVVGVSGLLGSGREGLNAAIFGAIPRDGEVLLGNNVVPAMQPGRSVKAGMGYVPPDRKGSGAMMGLSGRENLTIGRVTDFWRRSMMRRSEELREVRIWFDALQVRPSDGYELPLSNFSGGNQQKVLLAKWLRLQPRVLLLDEPTQGVDIAAKAQIHHHVLTAAAAGTAVVVSSVDVDELVALCHRVLVIRDGGLVASLTGGRLTVREVTRMTLSATDGSEAGARTATRNEQTDLGVEPPL